MLEILSEMLQNWLLEKKIRTQNDDMMTRELEVAESLPGVNPTEKKVLVFGCAMLILVQKITHPSMWLSHMMMIVVW
jgi:hypothetical protein